MDPSDEFIKAREKIYEMVREEMMGPGSENIGADIEYEVLSESPVQRYSTGILYPQKIKHGQENDELVNTEDNLPTSFDLDNYEEEKEKPIKTKEKGFTRNDEDGSNVIDEQINMANQMLPSSMGFTFFTKGEVSELNIRVSAAKYRKCKINDCCVGYSNEHNIQLQDHWISQFIYFQDGKLKLRKELTYDDINKLKVEGILSGCDELENVLYKLVAQCPSNKKRTVGYIREPIIIDNPIKIVFNENNYYQKEVVLESKFQLSVLKRNYKDDVKGFTVILLNMFEDENKDIDKIFFQPEIRINSDDNSSLKFIEYMNNPYISNQEGNKFKEEESIALLYRHKKTYATGHGVSAVFHVDEETGQGEIKTDFVPMYEVPKLNFNIDELKVISDKILPMKNLSDISSYKKDEIITYLTEFIETYGSWIRNIAIEVKKIDIKVQSAARRHLSECQIAYERMKNGIKVIESDAIAYSAFLLMNRAMLMQRAHSGLKERFPDDNSFVPIDYKSIKDKDGSWRPFQLAFVLLNINSLYDSTCKERELVDLIWVPTGGGKTEAYLGLTAFTIFLRRLKEPVKGGGTSIIMRYTLRLLAAQQFIRSSILICACELIRQEGKHNLGNEQITIGLWIGGESTPNTNEKAKSLIDELAKNVTPFNLKEKKEKNSKFQVLKCPWCGTKLVREVVNGELKGDWGYRKETKKITIHCTEQNCEFNERLPIQVVDECIYKSPPTLLFGTVDKFAMITWKEEASSLFGLNNNYLSPELIIQDELHLISGPLGTIVGVYEMAIDKLCSYKGVIPKIIASTATIRRAEEQCNSLYTRGVKQFPPSGLDAEDSFFTREIPTRNEPGRLYTCIMPSGKTQTSVEIRLIATLLQKIHMLDLPEEVKDKYWTLVGYFNSIRELGKASTLVEDDIKDYMRRLASRLADRKQTRLIFDADELTGRIPSGRITETLENLEIAWSKENMDKKKYAINVLLASNMISVGVDVARLNLMTVVGQPKLTSEYIQATSRVGRNFPGFVVTLYDSAKSRDRSHYEQFYSYHQSFYKYVEPTSVTPFSEPALDRMLHSVLISLMRHIGGLNAEEMASAFKKSNKVIKEIEEFILEKVKQVDVGALKSVKEKMEKVWGRWEERVDNLEDIELLTYSKEDKKHLIKPYGKKDNEVAMETLQSMRNVDSQSAVSIITFGGEKNE